jgi:peptidoglycan/LPS O-acetylase OafA/YrhL
MYSIVLLLALAGLPRFALHAVNVYLYPFNAPAWSLLDEMIGNLGYAAAIRRGVAWVVLPAACVLSLARLTYAAAHDPTMLHTDDLTALARVFFSFPVGVFLFYLYRRRHNTAQRTSALGVLLAFAATTLSLGFRSPFHAQWTQLFVIVIVFPALVYGSAGVAVPRPLLKACVLLGEVSYPVYMLQAVFQIPHLPAVDLLGQKHLPVLAVLIGLDLLILALVGIWVNRNYDERVRKKLTAWYRSGAAAEPDKTVRPI